MTIGAGSPYGHPLMGFEPILEVWVRPNGSA